MNFISYDLKSLLLLKIIKLQNLNHIKIVGNFRVHYAGFFDPGFAQQARNPAVLELRAYDTPFIIRDGQLVGQLNYYQIDEIKKIYGINIQSNYYNQNLKLFKQFK